MYLSRRWSKEWQSSEPSKSELPCDNTYIGTTTKSISSSPSTGAGRGTGGGRLKAGVIWWSNSEASIGFAVSAFLLRCPKFPVRCSLTKFRPLPRAQLACSATGSARIASQFHHARIYNYKLRITNSKFVICNL